MWLGALQGHATGAEPRAKWAEKSGPGETREVGVMPGPAHVLHPTIWVFSRGRKRLQVRRAY